MYLLDTNIFLEALLEQEKPSTVRGFFESIDLSNMFITDLALHSIGIILFRLGKLEIFESFLNDMVIDGIRVISLQANELHGVRTASQSFRLDFDDAYQYVAAVKYDLQLISFDRDFDHTERKRKEPSDVMP